MLKEQIKTSNKLEVLVKDIYFFSGYADVIKRIEANWFTSIEFDGSSADEQLRAGIRMAQQAFKTDKSIYCASTDAYSFYFVDNLDSLLDRLTKLRIELEKENQAELKAALEIKELEKKLKELKSRK